MALEVRNRRLGAGERAIEIIDVIGRLDTPGGAQLRSVVQKALKEGSSRVAINFSDCIEIHREITGTIHSLSRACRRAGGNLVLYGASGDVLEYIKTFVDPSMAPWYKSENEAIEALGGKVETVDADEGEMEPPVVVALGSNQIFRAVFWKLGKLGGRPVAKFDNIDSATNFIMRRNIHSLIVDASLSTHDVARLLRRIRTTPDIRKIGIFIIGPPSSKSTGRALMDEGVTAFVPFAFKGEEIVSKLDARKFFAMLKEAYDRYDAVHNSAKD